ncbi:MAG: hypothetical protein WBX15_13915 [Thermoanaerobaculia bacterium]
MDRLSLFRSGTAVRFAPPDHGAIDMQALSDLGEGSGLQLNWRDPATLEVAAASCDGRHLLRAGGPDAAAFSIECIEAAWLDQDRIALVQPDEDGAGRIAVADLRNGSTRPTLAESA